MSSHNICADLSQHSTVCIDTGRPIADIQLLAGSGNSRPTDVANCGDIYPKSSFMRFLLIYATAIIPFCHLSLPLGLFVLP